MTLKRQITANRHNAKKGSGLKTKARKNPTPKQIAANRRNAKKSTGPRTQTGKAISKTNNLRHGLLSQATIITTGVFKEDPKEFDSLLLKLSDYFKPVGIVEKILLEKVACSYWKMRRSALYEVGIMQRKFDSFNREPDIQNIIYSVPNKLFQRPEVIKQQIDGLLEKRIKLKSRLTPLRKLIKNLQGKGVNDANQIKEINDYLNKSDVFSKSFSKKEIQRYLKDTTSNQRVTDLKKFLLELRETIKKADVEIEAMRKELKGAVFVYEHEHLLGLSLSEVGKELETLTKYSVSIDREFYRALGQLERTQDIRKDK